MSCGAAHSAASLCVIFLKATGVLGGVAIARARNPRPVFRWARAAGAGKGDGVSTFIR